MDFEKKAINDASGFVLLSDYVPSCSYNTSPVSQSYQWRRWLCKHYCFPALYADSGVQGYLPKWQQYAHRNDTVRQGQSYDACSIPHRPVPSGQSLYL